MSSSGQADFRLESGDEVVLHVGVDLDLATKEAFRASLTDATDGGRPIVLDLSQVRFLDSSGLAVILTAHVDGGEMRLRGVSPVVRRTLEVAGVAELLQVES